MAEFRYCAQDENGKRITGVMRASDRAEVYGRLREQKLYLREIRSLEKEKRKQALSLEQTAVFCREMGTMLTAGVPLIRTLDVMGMEEERSPFMKQLYETMIRELGRGMSLSSVMEETQAFPPLLIHMLQAAEDSGTLPKTLLSMASYYEKEYQNVNQLKSATAYPKLLSGILAVALFAILGFIVPRFESLFASVENLPLATKLLMSASLAVRRHWQAILIGVCLAIILIKLISTLPAVRFRLDRMKLTAPLFGHANQVICTERFARTLSTLYLSGLPILSGLASSARTVGNRYIEQQMGRVIDLLRRGETLSEAIRTVEGFVPKLAVSISVGEETGALSAMLSNLADMLNHDAQRSMNKKIALIEPVLIITMGVFVLFIMLAVLIPIYQSYSAFM